MARILVVDDDTLVLASVQMRAGLCRTRGRRRRPGAKQCSRSRAVTFDAASSISSCREWTGYQTIKEFRQLDPELPVIGMSGILFSRVLGRACAGFSRHGEQDGGSADARQNRSSRPSCSKPSTPAHKTATAARRQCPVLAYSDQWREP